MRYTLIYAIILIAFIAAALYTAYTIFNITCHSIRNYDVMKVLRCVYTESICIVLKPVITRRIYLGNKPIYVIFIGQVALIARNAYGNCTNPPCLLINNRSGIYILPE